jgi:hypothetical protein
MLCGKCKNPILCRCCGETEYSDLVFDGHKFKPDDCEYCKENPTYINKDFMWHFKAITEAIQIFIGLICAIGFVGGMIFVIIAIPMVLGKPISYQPFPWLGGVMAYSISIGLINGLFIIARDNRWREDYIDRSTVDNIRE